MRKPSVFPTIKRKRKITSFWISDDFQRYLEAPWENLDARDCFELDKNNEVECAEYYERMFNSQQAVDQTK